MTIVASDWRAYERNTLRGFVTLRLEPSGIILRDCAFHQHPNGAQWLSPAAKPQLDSEGRQRRDPSGKALYTPIIEFASKASRERFQQAALAGVHKILDDGAMPKDRVPATRSNARPRKQKAAAAPFAPLPLPDDPVADLYSTSTP